MSEFVSSWHFSERDQSTAATAVGEEALAIIDYTYGSGYPGDTPGVTELAYHNGHHGREVGRAAARLCVYYDLSPVETDLARTAGFAHDIVQLKGRGIDEAESAEWLDASLETRMVLPPHFRQMGRLAIIGTEPLFEEGKLVGQKATTMEYPSRTAEIVGKGVASADLGELYVPEGPYLARQLLREIHGMGDPSRVTYEELLNFQRNQIALLENYMYPLKGAEKILATHKQAVISHNVWLLEQLEAGTLSTWDEVVALDRVFIEQHRQ